MWTAMINIYVAIRDHTSDTHTAAQQNQQESNEEIQIFQIFPRL
jgi:hypothetical protein